MIAKLHKIDDLSKLLDDKNEHQLEYSIFIHEHFYDRLNFNEGQVLLSYSVY